MSLCLRIKWNFFIFIYMLWYLGLLAVHCTLYNHMHSTKGQNSYFIELFVCVCACVRMVMNADENQVTKKNLYYNGWRNKSYLQFWHLNLQNAWENLRSQKHWSNDRTKKKSIYWIAFTWFSKGSSSFYFIKENWKLKYSSENRSERGTP